MRRGAAAGLLFGALSLVALRASADSADDATRTAARALGTAGVEAYQAKDFATATDELEKAYGILRVPSLGLWSGRALVQVGKWVEAANRFLETTSLQIPVGDYAVQKQAQADAAKELQALKPRIPMIVVELEGAEPTECAVTVDGQPVASTLLADGRLVDPGKHVVEATRGSDHARAEVTVAEAERPTVKLAFEVAPPPPAAPVAASAAPLRSVPAPPAPARDVAAPGSAQRTWGLVALGAGGVGLVVGGITGALALGKKGELDSAAGCEGNRCPPSEQSTVDGYNSLRTVSSVGFYAGGGLAVLGAVLLLTAPSSHANVQAWVGPSSAGLRGRF